MNVEKFVGAETFSPAACGSGVIRVAPQQKTRWDRRFPGARPGGFGPAPIQNILRNGKAVRYPTEQMMEDERLEDHFCLEARPLERHSTHFVRQYAGMTKCAQSRPNLLHAQTASSRPTVNRSKTSLHPYLGSWVRTKGVGAAIIHSRSANPLRTVSSEPNSGIAAGPLDVIHYYINEDYAQQSLAGTDAPKSATKDAENSPHRRYWRQRG